MSQIYNTQTKAPEALPEHELDQAIAAGTHAFPLGTQVNVVSPDGDRGALPSDQLQAAVRAGYRIEGAKEGAIQDYLEENAGLKGAAKVALGKLGSEALLGIPELIYEKKGNPDDVAKWEALKEAHPEASYAGGGAGFAGSLVIGGPLFKAAGKAGEIAAKGTAQALESYGLKRGSSALAKDIIARSVERAAALGTEGAVVSAPRALTEAALGDPDQAAEALLVGGGIGAALGLLSGPGAVLLNKVKTRYQGRLADAERLAQRRAELNAAAGAVGDGALSAAPEGAAPQTVGPLFEEPAQAGAEATAVPPESARQPIGQIFDQERELLAQGAASRAKNADSAQAAAERQGVPLFQTALSDNEMARAKAIQLSKSPTLAGQQFNKEVQATYEALDQVAGRVVGPPPDPAANRVSRFAVGQQVKEQIRQKVEAFRSFFGKGYGELHEVTGQFAIPEDARLELQQAIEGNKLMQLDSLKSESGQVKGILNDLLRANTVEDVSQLKTTVSNKLSEAHRAGNYNLTQLLDPIDKGLKAMREQAIERGLSEMTGRGGMELERATQLATRRGELDAQYRQFKEFIGQIAQEAKLGNIRDQNRLLAKIEAIPAESLADRLFNVKNARGLTFVRDQMPEIFDQLRQLKLSEIAERSVKDGKYQLHTLLNQVKALPSEAKAVMFSPAQRKALEDLRIIYERIPKNPNPSGTAHALALNQMFSLEGAKQQLKDAFSYGSLVGRGDEGIEAAAERMLTIQKRLEGIPQMLDRVSKGAGKAAPQSIEAATRLMEGAKDPREAIEKLQGKLADLQGNPDALASRVGEISTAVHQTGAPKTADALTAKLTAALAYLSGQVPRPTAAPNPFNPQAYQPSDAAVSKFQRKLQVVMDPLSVLDDLEHGTLQADQVEALQAVYPQLANAMRTRILDHVTQKPQAMPYAARIRLSLLMGVPLDPSLSPQAVQSYQAAYQDPAPIQPHGSAQTIQMSGRLAPPSQRNTGAK